ncbi:hypothetical protein Val02_71420 [Virgisporangium aliadipatigenens]|uniref:Uncharacterized protein n=1 Tax=Virgisporangium aliadipatigenens TaxID=741659 RepID=A0A8J3YUX0_9ACTN|nr:hypothetical protein [Virgisporangium aliadipatigenens]GIJ50256.1 hypothetical protein Val02_71420 [Virgisporangium aliadipatigenens]
MNRSTKVSAGLLAVQAALALVGVALAVRFGDVVSPTAFDGNALAKQFAGGPIHPSAIGVGVAVLVSAGFLTLAVLVVRGSRRGRTLARIACGLGLLAFVGGGVLLTSPTHVAGTAPGWYTEYGGFAAALALLCYIGTIALLSLRHSSSRPT